MLNRADPRTELNRLIRQRDVERDRLREENRAVSQALEEAERAAAAQEIELEQLRRLAAIGRGLEQADLNDSEDPGLPDWAVSIAQGEEPPPDLGVSQETVEELLLVAEQLELPEVKTPELRLVSHGMLAAVDADTFSIAAKYIGGGGTIPLKRDIGSGVLDRRIGQPICVALRPSGVLGPARRRSARQARWTETERLDSIKTTVVGEAPTKLGAL